MKKIIFFLVLCFGSLLISQEYYAAASNEGVSAINEDQFTLYVPLKLDKLPDEAMLNGYKISYLLTCYLRESGGRGAHVAYQDRSFDGSSNIDKTIVFHFNDIPIDKLHTIKKYECKVSFKTSIASTSVYSSDIVGLPGFSEVHTDVLADIE